MKNTFILLLVILVCGVAYSYRTSSPPKQVKETLLSSFVEPQVSPESPSESSPEIAPTSRPAATATLVLGILSIVVCFICGIIALVISNKDVALYKANPELYAEGSYNSIKAGRICAIIGIALQVIGLIIYIVMIAFFISAAESFR